ncbi:MAG TPA: nicotinate-nucleotide adenylyltransferase [Candidatus Latescibacteria bacterium]|nr:nicotinate-nucleotide adenylyltransferase [Candidatus Latescibacterota bacterium]
MKLGVLGGTFDPIHIGHLILAQEAYVELGLERVIFVPAADPPHKDPRNVSPVHHRFQMVKLAVEGDPRFHVSDLELRRSGKSYTVDTLRHLKELWPASELFLLIGADNLRELPTWKDYQELFQLSEVVVAHRPGAEPEVELADRVRFLPIPMVSVSASWIRERVAGGKPIRYLVPRKVERYIMEHGLYVCS